VLVHIQALIYGKIDSVLFSLQ